MKRAILMLIILACGLSAGANPARTLDDNGDGKADQWYETDGSRVIRASFDRNYDGRIDYTVQFDEEGGKSYEELDFDFDGVMDDFYFYEEGTLVREEIDSNFDGRVDVWVHFYDGVYIQSYEMDTDFDGRIDLRKEY